MLDSVEEEKKEVVQMAANPVKQASQLDIAKMSEEDQIAMILEQSFFNPVEQLQYAQAIQRQKDEEEKRKKEQAALEI